jgi:short-subunit dehydrogenase
VARRKERLDELAEELRSQHRVRVETLACDLAKPAARGRMASHVDELGLTVEILVNNAGFGTYGDFAAADRESEVEMVRLNIEAVIDLAGRYLPGMVERGRGAVINTASTAAFQPLPGNATYAATKAFVLSHSEALHEEVKGRGVTVTALCPGPVKTEFAEKAGLGEAEDRLPDLFWVPASKVAEMAVAGAERGRRVVVPGRIHQATAIAGRHSPHTVALPLVARVFRRFG